MEEAKRDMREKIVEAKDEPYDAVGCTLAMVLIVAWITSVCVSIANHLWILLLSTAIFFPIGIIHGIGYWLGFFH